MKTDGPIVIVDDDQDDRYLLDQIFQKLNYKHEIIYFRDGVEAYEYLVSCPEWPFLIISDINMPKMTGLELREKINSNEALRLKCIPYVFLTTSSSPADVNRAYNNNIQGFFEKPRGITMLETTIIKIVEYWDRSLIPAS